jgi:putative acetyltransferase
MKVRCYQPDDAAALAHIFTESVHTTCKKDYSAEQIAAWAPEPPDLEHWRRELDSRIVYIAEIDSEIAGFITFEPDGHLDHLYVHSRFQRCGVASALYRRLEEEAVARGVHRIFTEASITARQFFESTGFRAIASQMVERSGILLTNCRMEKFLPKSD